MSEPLKALSFLVIEDNAHMRFLITALLRGFGAGRIDTCDDGTDALIWLTTNSPDIIITDLRMLPTDGLEFTRLLRRHDNRQTSLTPVIMLSGYSEKLHVEQARDAGVNEFLVKPMTAGALYDRIVSIINRPRMFVRTTSYVGPDRRRRANPDYHGELRRATDTLAEDDFGSFDIDESTSR
jgi:CheY-like chemotaxis protein